MDLSVKIETESGPTAEVPKVGDNQNWPKPAGENKLKITGSTRKRVFKTLNKNTRLTRLTSYKKKQTKSVTRLKYFRIQTKNEDPQVEKSRRNMK